MLRHPVVGEVTEQRVDPVVALQRLRKKQCGRDRLPGAGVLDEAGQECGDVFDDTDSRLELFHRLGDHRDEQVAVVA